MELGLTRRTDAAARGDVRSKAAALHRFALGTLLPLCRDRYADGIDGGFHERLDAGFVPLPTGRKRVLVQARQLYVLAHGSVAGDASGRDAAIRGYAFLQRYHDTAHGGWFFSADPAGYPLDRAKDLYGHAFVLFALAWMHRAFAVPGAIGLAHDTMDALHRQMAAPAGGFWERATQDWTPDRAAMRQNPHMHLLEAMLALHDATGEARWRDEADALVALFLTHMFDAGSGTLGEHFGPDWTAHPTQGHIVEPGHHFEWVWLLQCYQAAGGRHDARAAAGRLFEIAVAHGFDPLAGGLHDQIDRSYQPILTTRRIWPVTEAIKACVARHALGDPLAEAHAEGLIGHLFDSFLLPDMGRWTETLTREGAATQTELPGSTPYHVFLAAMEAATAFAA